MAVCGFAEALDLDVVAASGRHRGAQFTQRHGGPWCWTSMAVPPTKSMPMFSPW